MIEPHSADAGLIASLWWGMLAIGSLILIAVLALLVVAVLRARHAGGEERPLATKGSWLLVVGGGLALPIVVVFALVVTGTGIGAEIAARQQAAAVTMEIVGQRWWWEVRYQDRDGALVATTANEIHVPVGQPVHVRLRSDNVIHSFWVPSLQGKTDLVPGRVNELWLTADRPGVYRGQCAEYCGLQHALMAFLVVAEPPAEFQAWLDRQARPAAAPDGDRLTRGREVFKTAGCAGCHAIRGVQSVGVLGPDLTHVGSRRTLAAGTLPNEPENLTHWIESPDDIKPGALMPATALEPERLDALVAYLTSLQ